MSRRASLGHRAPVTTKLTIERKRRIRRDERLGTEDLKQRSEEDQDECTLQLRTDYADYEARSRMESIRVTIDAKEATLAHDQSILCLFRSGTKPGG